MRARRLGWLAVPLFTIASLGAASTDARLVDAVKKADKAAIKKLLQQKVDVNQALPDGTTALHLAAQQDDLATVQELVRAGANVKAANRYGVTPLTVACINGNAAVVETLLKAGADANAALPEGETVLMTTSRTGNPEVIKILLAHGAKVDSKESWRGQTALMWAAAENHADAIKTLVEAGADIDARSNGGFTPLLFAARAGRVDAVTALTKLGAKANDAIQTSRPQAGPTMGIYTRPAGAAGAGANATNVAYTGTRGIGGPNGTSALVLAVMNGHFELAAKLVELGADPNADAQGWTPLHQLAWTRRPPIQHGLPNAVFTGHMDSLALAKVLLAHGANPNARQKKEPADGARNVLNRIGATPFLLAAKAGDTDYMRVLVAGGADPKAPTDEHATPLMAAAGVGVWHTGENAGTNAEALEAVKLCVELGNDVNAVDDNGDTALHGASYRQAPAIATYLVQKGARLDARNKIGWTPLTVADGVMYPNTFNRSEEVKVILLNAGAKDMGQRRPEDLPPADVFDAAQKSNAQKQDK